MTTTTIKQATCPTCGAPLADADAARKAHADIMAMLHGAERKQWELERQHSEAIAEIRQLRFMLGEGVAQ